MVSWLAMDRWGWLRMDVDEDGLSRFDQVRERDVREEEERCCISVRGHLNS